MPENHKAEGQNREELLREIGALRARVAQLETSEAHHRLIEEVLRTNAINYWNLLGSIPQRVFFKDPRSVYVAVNPAYARDLGVLPEDMIGKTDYDFHPRELAEEYRAADRRILRSGKPEDYDQTYRSQGKTLTTHNHKAPVRDQAGNIIGIFGIFWDITERKLAEDRLRQFSRVVEQCPASIVITDLKGEIEYVNPKFTKMTGYTQAEVFGKNPRILKSGETPSEDYRQLWECLAAGREWQGEFHNRKKSGELFWEYARISPIVGPEGTIQHLVAIKEDISGRKEAEAERERLIAELQAALADVSTLSGIIPICASCKRIRDDQGFWNRIEKYIQDRSLAKFSHGICPECAEKLYPELDHKSKPREEPTTKGHE